MIHRVDDAKRGLVEEFALRAYERSFHSRILHKIHDANPGLVDAFVFRLGEGLELAILAGLVEVRFFRSFAAKSSMGG